MSKRTSKSLRNKKINVGDKIVVWGNKITIQANRGSFNNSRMLNDFYENAKKNEETCEDFWDRIIKGT